MMSPFLAVNPIVQIEEGQRPLILVFSVALTWSVVLLFY
jgi:hypothetical protein